MLETAPLAGPAAHVCAKETPRNPASEEFLMITQSVSHRKTRPAHYSDSERQLSSFAFEVLPSYFFSVMNVCPYCCLNDGDMVHLISYLIFNCFVSIVFKYISIFQMLSWCKLRYFHWLLQNTADPQHVEITPLLFQFTCVPSYDCATCLSTFHWLYKSQQQPEEGRQIFGKIPQGENSAICTSGHLHFQNYFARSARSS